MFLGIDCGTQGTKALLLSDEGLPLGRGYAPHSLMERATGAREQEPQWWLDALTIAVRQAVAAQASDVRALGVSGQQHGLVILDETHAVIRPAKLWNDTETAPQNARLIEMLGGRRACIDRFGILPMTGYTVSKLLWLKEVEPENFARIRHILLPHEYLNFWLTGKMAAEYGDASGTAFFDVRTRNWAHDVLDAIDGNTGQLVAALPPLISAENILGTLRPEAANLLGLPVECMVSSGGGDNMMGAIGTGNVQPGVVTLSLGTSSTVYSFQSAPLKSGREEVAPFCSSSGGWLPLVCTMNATNVVTQTLKVLNKTVSDIEDALAATTPGADGLVFLPFLNGERTPDLPLARGMLSGLSSTNFTPAHLIRAVIEGVSFGVLDGLNLILAGKPAERILAIGGGARSPGWRQLLADATGAVVQVPHEEEAGCLGAAIQAYYAWSAATATPVSFTDITDKWVQVEDAKTSQPRVTYRVGYDLARQKYREELARAFGV